MHRNHLDLIEPKLPQFGKIWLLFDKEDHPSVAWVQEQLIEHRIMSPSNELFEPFSALYYSVLRCQPHRPLWHLDKEVTHLLAVSPVPYDYLAQRLPLLPYEGFYVTLPDTGLIMSGDSVDQYGHTSPTDALPYEGLYICEDFFLDHLGELRPAITVTAISSAPQLSEVRFYGFTIPAGVDRTGKPYVMRVDEMMWENFVGGQLEIFSIAMNLLLALEGRYLQEEHPEVARSPRNKSLIKLFPDGVLTNPYTVIHLTRQGRAHLLAKHSQEFWEQGSHRSPVAHMRGEHWHSYWVAEDNIGDQAVMGRKSKEGGGWLYRVRKPLDEMKVGKGPIRRPLYLVRK